MSDWGEAPAADRAEFDAFDDWEGRVPGSDGWGCADASPDTR